MNDRIAIWIATRENPRPFPLLFPIEIHAADGVALIDAEIHFAERVVDANVVGKSLHDVDALRVVQGKPVPLQVTVPAAETVQPEINWLAGLIQGPLQGPLVPTL